MQAFGGLDWGIALKFKIKQSKNCTVTHKFLHFPTNYNECQMIAVKKCQIILLLRGVHSSVLAWISTVHTNKELAWLSFRKIYVLKASFSKNVLQITDMNFLPTII